MSATTPPRRLSPRELIARQEVGIVLAALPPEIRAEADRCAIIFERAYEDPEDPLLGLFEGFARNDPTPQAPDELPRITLYLDTLWEEAGGDPEEYREQVAGTLLHELGHYLGLDEEGVAALGLG